MQDRRYRKAVLNIFCLIVIVRLYGLVICCFPLMIPVLKSRRLRNSLSRRLNACPHTDGLIEDQAKKLEHEFNVPCNLMQFWYQIPLAYFILFVKSGYTRSWASTWHYSDVIMSTMASQITSCRLFTQPFMQAPVKVNIKASRHWPLWGEFTIPAQRTSNAENVSIWWRHHGPARSEQCACFLGCIVYHDKKEVSRAGTSHRYYGMWLLVPALDTCFWNIAMALLHWYNRFQIK